MGGRKQIMCPGDDEQTTLVRTRCSEGRGQIELKMKARDRLSKWSGLE